MKKLISIFLSFLMILTSACSDTTSKTENVDDSSSKPSSTFQTTESSNSDTHDSQKSSNSVETITFEDANILSFELTNRDDESYSEIISTFKVTNNSKNKIDYFSADFSYYDASGNQICDDGRFHDCQIDSEKSALMVSYSDLDDHEKSEIDSIVVTSYNYIIGSTSYTVDTQLGTVKTREHTIDNDANFDIVNIIAFELEGKGLNSIGSYEVECHATNSGSNVVTYISFRMAYFDEDGNFLDSDGRFNDDVVNAGKFVTMKSYGSRNGSDVKSFGIYSYSYKLAEDDENGYNSYDINLQTHEVKARHID